MIINNKKNYGKHWNKIQKDINNNKDKIEVEIQLLLPIHFNWCMYMWLSFVYFVSFVNLLFFMDAFIWIELWKKQFYYHCAKEKCNVTQKVNWLKGINFLNLSLSLSFGVFLWLFFGVAGKAKISLEAAVRKLGICQRGRHHTHTNKHTHTFSEIFNLNESFARLHSGELHVPLTT